MEPHLHRQGSTVPVSCHQRESCVINTPLGKSWEIFRHMKFEVIAPSKVKATSFTSGKEGELGAILRVDYADGARWELRISEISELRHSIGYEVISTEPAHSVTSI